MKFIKNTPNLLIELQLGLDSNITNTCPQKNPVESLAKTNKKTPETQHRLKAQKRDTPGPEEQCKSPETPGHQTISRH